VPVVRALLLCIVLAAPFALPVAAHAPAPDRFHRGFVLTGWKAGTYLTPGSDVQVARMARDGSDHAAIFTQWFMDGPASSNLAPDPLRTPTDASILHAAAVARENGMEVTLKPQIGIRTGSWIGAAHPASLPAFWAGYRAMLIHYADLAETAHASLLVVGTEMRTLSGEEGRWRALIAEIRQHFGGKLTYAANHDEFERVPFWDALDYVGIDAYFPLAAPPDPAPPAGELAAAWSKRGYLARIAATSARTGKRVLFTELGYRAGRATAAHPSVWNVRDTTDVGAQRNAYQAFYDAVADKPWMAGVYWWSVDPESRWVQDYSPIGKPAEQVVARANRR
jgi:hypothetical protein